MNIVTPILNAIAYPTANINTESARRDNVQRETIPQTSDAEQGASQKGLGSEADKAKSPGQPPAPVTYERPQVQTELQAAFQNVFGQDKDNAQDESAGKQDAQSEQQARQREQQQEQQDTQEIEQLKARDQEVRTHEQAHAATGGQYAGSPQYEYTTGPDNKRYVTDGEVSIDISEAQSPEQTLRKMQQVRAAALAPAQPSSQDLKVAAEAAQKAFEARSDIAEENREARESESSEGVSASEPTIPSIDDITDTAGVERPTRSLDDAVLKTEQGNSSEDTSQGASNEVGTRSLNFGNTSELNGDNAIQARIGRIQNAYTQAYTPAREGLSLQA
ncbi:hypothetical protein KUL152_15300 [Tenacibaculum sp. KUL152]|nr:hypothetical protein KUL152_15300 [Tenacibaculum sp. KUL152]